MPLVSQARQNAELSRNEIIVRYFNLGLSGPEILSFLLELHGIRLGMRQLRRILKELGCKRRQVQSDIDQIIDAVEKELCSSGQLIGYRAMHQRLITDHRLIVNRGTSIRSQDSRPRRSRTKIQISFKAKEIQCQRIKLFMVA